MSDTHRSSATADKRYSPDGNWYWDGSSWIPATRQADSLSMETAASAAHAEVAASSRQSGFAGTWRRLTAVGGGVVSILGALSGFWYYMSNQSSELPNYQVISYDQQGPCDDYGCPVTGTFKNVGGAGTGVATFVVLDSNDVVLGSCTATIPPTQTGDSGDAHCVVNSTAIQSILTEYADYSTVPIHLGVTVRQS